MAEREKKKLDFGEASSRIGIRRDDDGAYVLDDMAITLSGEGLSILLDASTGAFASQGKRIYTDKPFKITRGDDEYYVSNDGGELAVYLFS